MDFLTSTILSGVAWDGIKKLGSITGSYLKDRLKGWILEENDYEKIANIINESPECMRSTEKFLDAFIDSNEDIKSILEKAKSTSNYNQCINNSEFTNSPVIQGSGATVIINTSGNELKKSSLEIY